MTREQREHIAAAVGDIAMGAAILRKEGFIDAADVMAAQCKILRKIIDNDVGEL